MPVPAKERTALWQKFKAMFEKIVTDKYEIQVLKIYDFPGWIEAKICKKNLELILKTKFNFIPDQAAEY